VWGIMSSIGEMLRRWCSKGEPPEEQKQMRAPEGYGMILRIPIERQYPDGSKSGTLFWHIIVWWN